MTIKQVSERYNISVDTLRYYERVGMIPPVNRTASGIRDYQSEDLKWVELAICMRGAGLPVETMIEYVRLCHLGDVTIPNRLQLLEDQRAVLQEQRRQIDETIARLDHKIERYVNSINSEIQPGTRCRCRCKCDHKC